MVTAVSMPTCAMAQQGNSSVWHGVDADIAPAVCRQVWSHRYAPLFHTIDDTGELQTEEVSEAPWREIGSISDEFLRCQLSKALG